ncbi:MAG: response regulator [Verrucomicrobiota bacterium]|jgi:CheY-like chemotaxis protein
MAGGKILIIEDNPMNLDLAADLLQANGYVVLKAENALKGIAMAKTDHPDLILMDISLPDLDGLEATRRLKLDPATRQIPIIALTAHAMKGDEEKALAAGCQGYLTKPIDTRSFPKQVGRFIAADGGAT